MPLNLHETTWMPIPERCDPLDDLLKAQGVGLIKRKLISKLASGSVIAITQTDDLMTITSEGVKTRVDTIGLNWTGHKNPEGQLGPEEWTVSFQDGGEKLVCEIKIQGKGTRTVERYLESEKVLVAHLKWVGLDGQKAEVKRHFKKVKKRAA